MSELGHLRHFERPLEMSAMLPIATENGEPLKRRRRARSRRRAAARERQAPVERPAPPPAWPVVHSAAGPPLRGQPLDAFRAPLPAALDRRGNRRLLHRPRRQRAGAGYVYFEDEPGRRSAARLLTRNDARRIAANIGKLQLHKLAGPAPTSVETARAGDQSRWKPTPFDRE
jgi:hypothetical protein